MSYFGVGTLRAEPRWSTEDPWPSAAALSPLRTPEHRCFSLGSKTKADPDYPVDDAAHI